MSKFEIINFHSVDKVEDSAESKNSECDNQEDKFSFSKKPTTKFGFVKRKKRNAEVEEKSPSKKKVKFIEKSNDDNESQREAVPPISSNSIGIDQNFQKRLERLEKEFLDFKNQQIRLLTNPEYMTDPPITY